MSISERIAGITREHARARAIAGVTGRTTTRGLSSGAPSRMAADAVTAAERARDARIMSERARHDEAARLARRIRMIEDARAAAVAAGDEERAARLVLLAGDVESARDRYVYATFQRGARVEDWAPGGRFTRYARRFDLGFIGYTPDDVAQDAAEILTAAGMFAPDGADAGHTIGDAYRALRHAYRRGLGFYGYERRGRLVTRDTTERGYTVGDSSTVEDIRMRAHARAELVAALIRDGVEPDTDEGDVLTVARSRMRGLQTLATRFPLNADGRMLALATLLTEGYTIEEITEGLGVSERTLNSWAAELGNVSGMASAERDTTDTRDAFEVIADLADAAR